MKKIVAVCACPMGLAHTFMAADSLEKAAKELGVEIKIETQGADGIQNELTKKDITESDAIILALAITPQGMERFEGYDPYEITLKEAIREGKEILEEIVEEIILRSFDVLRKAGINRVKGNVVLTGGTTLMPGVLDLAKDMLRKMNVRIGSPKIIGANSPELSVVVGTLTSSYKIESLFGYQVTDEVPTVKNTNSTFENVSAVEEISVSNSKVETPVITEPHTEEEEEVYYEEEKKDKEKEDKNFFDKITKMYNSFFE